MGFFDNSNMGLTGYAVRDPNFYFRFFVIIFMGIMALGAVLYWRTQLLISSEYVNVPMAKHLTKHQIYQDLDQ